MDRPKTRVCSKCGKRKPLTREYFAPRLREGKPGYFNGVCRPCYNAGQRLRDHDRYWKDPEAARAKDKKNRQKYKASIQRAAKKNHLKNLERNNAYNRDYHHSHSFQSRARAANTWARKRGSQGVVTARMIALIYHRQRGRCFYCSTRLDRTFQVDHKIPLDRKGPNTPRNLCCTCHKCNKRKQNKSVKEFRKLLITKYGLPEPELASLRVA